VLLEVLDAILRLLHPMMPFVTEEIWQRLPHEGASLMVAAFPRPDAGKRDAVAESDMERLQQLVTEIRTIRSTYEVEPRRRIDVTIAAAGEEDRGFVERNADLVRDLAKIETLTVKAKVDDAPGTLKHAFGAFDLRIRLPMAGPSDIAAEKTRLTKERLKIDAELEGLRKKLDNPQFVERAKPEVVAQNRARVVELEAQKEKVEATLRELGSGT
jgi:valyl-tRNA synthetase